MNAQKAAPTKARDQGRPAPAPNPNAVVVFDPVKAGSALVAAVETRKPQLAALLGVSLEDDRGRAAMDRFVTVALHAATSRPDILRATTESLVESIRDAAMFGLEPVGATGDGSIVVYNEKRKEIRTSPDGTRSFEVEVSVPTAHFQPMYRGLLKLARRSDEIAYIDAAVAYEGDLIEIEQGSDPFVRHVSAIPRAPNARPIVVYAVAELPNGKKYVDSMTVAEVEVSRKQSRAKDAMAWTSFWGEMARKTVLRRLMKRLPLETLAETALRKESEAEERASGYVDQAVPAAAPARERIRARLGQATASLATEDGAAAPTDAPTGTNTSPDGESAVSGRSSASEDPGPPEEAGAAPKEEVVEGEAKELPAEEALCGATSDPALGDPETCIRDAGHDGPHRSKEDSRWPNSK